MFFQWSRIFIFMGILMITFTIVFDFTAQVKLREWAKSNNERKDKQIIV